MCDEVETDVNYTVLGVVKASGSITFRVWFGDSRHLEIKDEVQHYIDSLGVLLEWSSDNLLAISADNINQAQQVADYLYARQNLGELMYETGHR